MPISDEIKANNKIDFKQKYINLKRKLKLLIYENESYAEELRKSERQLLQVSRDKSYLLDRLLQYEKIESSTSDSEDTLSSDSEVETRKLEAKKKKTSESNEAQSSSNTSRKKKSTTNPTLNRSRSCSTGKSAKTQTTTSSTSITTSTMTMPLIKSELSLNICQSLTTCSQSSKASVSSTSSVNSTIDGHMTSEELERHLESRRQPSALLMPEKTPLTVPVELFSNESSNGLPEDDNHIHIKTIP